jgi:hypothetical protein
MGANAQTAVPAFVAGEVLTAAEMTQVNTGIPVFATTVTRDAAFGGTGEKTLAEGQFAYIEATDTTQYYDGAAWQTLGATPGLKVVKAETAFSAAVSVTADSVFTSSYTNYRILITSATTAGNPQLNITLRAGGVAATTNYAFQQVSFSGGTVTASNSTAQAQFVGGLTATTVSQWAIDFFNPQIAASTQMIMSMQQGGTLASWLYWGQNTNATSYDGIGFAPGSSTITGSYTIYGYGKAL